MQFRGLFERQIGCSTGRSASLAPLRTRSMKYAERRYVPEAFGPQDMRPPPRQAPGAARPMTALRPALR
jgi:hypothetical protein